MTGGVAAAKTASEVVCEGDRGWHLRLQKTDTLSDRGSSSKDSGEKGIELGLPSLLLSDRGSCKQRRERDRTRLATQFTAQ